MQLRLNTIASLIENQLNDLQDGKGYSARIDVERELSPTTGIGANLSLDREALKDPVIRHLAGALGWWGGATWAG